MAKSELRWGALVGLGLVVVVILAIGSAVRSSAKSTSARMRTPPVLTDHRFGVAATPARRLGEDCSLNGKSDCQTGLCFHYRPNPGTGWVCSSTCKSVSDCPSGWGCSEVVPGSGEAFCAPPASWLPGVAAPQGNAGSAK